MNIEKEILDASAFRRYAIETRACPNIAPHPQRFTVEVKKHRLALLILKELLHYRGNWKVVSSRPCVYGVFSGPVGGFAPRQHLCVGCLRCTTEHPDIVQIRRNPARELIGDSYFTPGHIDTVLYEAETGRVPVKGAGYRGRFSGEGWDGMWTDMSEIVRPTRDGIHGREFISTAVDIGRKLPYVAFDGQGQATENSKTFSLPIPFLFDIPPASANSSRFLAVLAEAARATGTLAIVPLRDITTYSLYEPHIVPLVAPEDAKMLRRVARDLAPRMIEMTVWQKEFFYDVEKLFPESIVALRMPFRQGFVQEILEHRRNGVHVFHLTADYHGKGYGDKHISELALEAHRILVDAGCRDEVTLVGSGGIIAAEHVPKAIICGMDAVALDTALLVSLQACFSGECFDRTQGALEFSEVMDTAWGVTRLCNLLASWRDQLLEILGAMGLREVRRLRGELGRAIFVTDAEREAFGGIDGYSDTH